MIQHNPKFRRLTRVRSKLLETLGIPRLTVFRSNRHIWAQIIDDKHGKTLVASSTKALGKLTGNKTEQAQAVGKDIATKALKLNIVHIKFDRGIYRYHGRVKALSDAARSQGLKF
jgi:large subunit ribosomal protein L18